MRIFGANNSRIAGNTIIQATSHPMEIKSNNWNLTVTQNNFIESGEGNTIVGGLTTESTVFIGNFYSDWVEPDANEDGIVDQAYNVVTGKDYTDTTPQTDPYYCEIDFVTKALI